MEVLVHINTHKQLHPRRHVVSCHDDNGRIYVHYLYYATIIVIHIQSANLIPSGFIPNYQQRCVYL